MVSLRKEFPIFKEKIYLDFASISPFSKFHRKSFLEAYDNQREFKKDIKEEIEDLKKKLKDQIAKFIGAGGGKNIALTPNTSYGLSLIASGLNLKKGDRILIGDIEFPANVYPYLYLREKGINVDLEKFEKGVIDLKQLKKKIKIKTKLISISFVQFLNGYKANLKEIGDFCKEEGIIFIVDGIQGVGACPIDVTDANIDGLSCGGAKWLMWPQGTGFLYLSDKIFNKIKPPIVGWLSFKDPWDFLNYKRDLPETSERFEFGTINFMGFYCAYKLLSIFQEIGIEKIYKKILTLRKIFLDGLKELKIKKITPDEGASGIVTIKIKNPEKAYNFLKDKGIIISHRLGYLRFSFHFINNFEDIKKALYYLSLYKKTGRSAGW